MGELVDRLGSMAPGQLIRSEDWNALVAEVEVNRDAIAAMGQQLGQRLDELAGRVGDVESRLDALESLVEPYFRTHVRLALRSTALRAVMGQSVEITASVLDLAGRELDLSNAATRPWIDFVTLWGRLKPVAGFTSAGGVGDRTISVQVNAQGLARVQLRPDHVEGLSEEVENQVGVLLEARPIANQPRVFERMLAAATPVDADVTAAFRTLSAEYDRVSAQSLRHFTDAYYAQSPATVTGGVAPSIIERWRHGWRDERATVLAFAKPDADATTPDHALGVATIQITFRDWIGPWIVIDYLPSRTAIVTDFRERLPRIITNKLDESIFRIRDEVETYVRDMGVLGRIKTYSGVREAIAGLPPTTQPQILTNLTTIVGGAMAMQQSMETSQLATMAAAGQGHAFAAFLGSAGVSEQSAGGARDLAARANEAVGGIRQDVGQQVRREVEARVEELQQPGGALENIRAEITTTRDQVFAMNTGLGDVTRIQRQMQKVDEVSDRLDRALRVGPG